MNLPLHIPLAQVVKKKAVIIRIIFDFVIWYTTFVTPVSKKNISLRSSLPIFAILNVLGFFCSYGTKWVDVICRVKLGIWLGTSDRTLDSNHFKSDKILGQQRAAASISDWSHYWYSLQYFLHSCRIALRPFDMMRSLVQLWQPLKTTPLPVIVRGCNK